MSENCKVDEIVLKDENISDDSHAEINDTETIKDASQMENCIDIGDFKVPQQISISSFGLKNSSRVIKSALSSSAEEKPIPSKSKSISDKSDKKKTDDDHHEDSMDLSKMSHPKPEPIKPKLSLSYKEPSWGGYNELSSSYKLEIIKEGTVIENVSLSGKSVVVIGRLSSCDVPMDHLSISRFHALLQYRVNKTSIKVEKDGKCEEEEDEIDSDEAKKEKDNENKVKNQQSANNDESNDDGDNSSVGWYIYDLDSVHGTWVNKHKLPPRKYIRIRVGHVLKFGGSKRLFVVQGPDSDRESESQLSVTELQKLKREIDLAKMLEEADQKTKMAEKERKERLREENRGCSWGMGDDEDVGSDEDNDPNAVNPFSELTDESLYIEDPKKAIRGFCEREGLDEPEYEFLDADTTFIGAGFKRRCRLELPIDGPNGQPLYAEVEVSGKKKDAVVACALEACRMLDRYGVLRQSKHESRAKKRQKNWADADYYDSDDDTYLDRTGDVEKKRQHRIQKAETAKIGSKAETYGSLKEKLDKVLAEIGELEEKLTKDEELKSKSLKEDGDDNVDALDAFMKSIKAGGLDMRTKIDVKRRLLELRHQRIRLESLVALSKPCDIKIISNKKVAASTLFGKKQNFSKLKKPEYKKEPSKVGDGEEEEKEDEEEETNANKQQAKETTSSNNNNTDNKSFDGKIDDIRKETPDSKNILNDKKRKLDETSNTQSASQNATPTKSSNNVAKSKTSSSSSSSSLSVSSVAKKLKEEMDVLPAQDGADYSTWLPPSNQTGDGRTKLNEKYGY